MAAEPQPGVIAISGRRPGDRLGIWVEAGDLDGDGLLDLIVAHGLIDTVAFVGYALAAQHLDWLR